MEILYEDDGLVIVSKPEGVPTIPDRRSTPGDLSTSLSARFESRIYVVHRLDRETSGIVVFARTAEMHRWLSGQFEARKVKKDYLAVVHGVFVPEHGFVDRPLRVFGSGRSAVDEERGKPSVTEYRVIRRIGCFSLVTARPVTGRQHQIRAHMYSIGHPVAGDPRYGDSSTQRSFPRMMLHAYRIDLALPSGGSLTVDSPPPESFLSALAALGRA